MLAANINSRDDRSSIIIDSYLETKAVHTEERGLRVCSLLNNIDISFDSALCIRVLQVKVNLPYGDGCVCL